MVLEKAGIPTAYICTSAFVETALAAARNIGAPSYPFVVTDHPVAPMDSAEATARGVGLADEVGRLLII